MANLLIVEDEALVANGLAKMVRSINNDIEVSITGYAQEALNYAKNINYDAFLLDIQLKDYSGFELAKEIRSIDYYKLTPIIFITAIPTRELVAFKEIHCYDYIIKPFKEREVKNALETIINYGIKKDKKRAELKLKQKDYHYIIAQDEIVHIESRYGKVIITTIKEQIDLPRYTLKGLMDNLTDNFIQCHRGYIVNTDYIEKVDKSDYNIYLKGIEFPIPIGRKYKDYLRSKDLWD